MGEVEKIVNSSCGKTDKEFVNITTTWSFRYKF